MRLAVFASICATALSSHAFAQECPQNDSHLPPVIDETSAWCPQCAHGALETIDATLGEAAALDQGVDRETKTIMNIVRAEETGSAKPDYASMTYDSGGLTYGAYQFDSNSGELHDLLSRYIARGGRDADQFRPYVSAMAHGKLPHDAALRTLLREAASDPIMQQTQDDYFIDAHVKPSMAAAAALGIRSPMGVAVYVDIQTNGGIDSVIKSAKAQAGAIHTPEDESRFVKAMLDAREARYRRLARHGYGQYLKGWLGRNNDLRGAFAKNGLGLDGKIGLPHAGVSFCAGDAADARAFGLYMASVAEDRDGAKKVALIP